MPRSRRRRGCRRDGAAGPLRRAAVLAVLRAGRCADASSTSAAVRARSLADLARRPRLHPGGRRRRLGARAGARRPPAAAGPDAAERQRERLELVPVVADLPRRAAERASTPPCSWRSSSTSTRRAWPRWSGASSATPRPGTVVVTTPNVEYNVRYPGLPAGALRHRGPPVRVDPRRVPRLGRRASARVRLRRPVSRPVGADEDPEVGPPTQLAVFTREVTTATEPRTDLSVPELCAGRARRRLRLGQVHLRARALRADRGHLERLLPRPGRRRRERPVGHAATPSTCCTTSPASGCAAGRLTVVDATNVQPDARGTLVALAREHDVLPVAIVLDVPEAVCARAQRRPARPRLRRRTSSGASTTSCAAVAASGLAARGLPQGPRAARRDEVAARDDRRASGCCNDLRARAPGRSTSIGDVHGCRAELEDTADRARLRIEWRRAGPAGRRRAPRRAHGGLRRRPGRPRPGHARACCAW